jgi:hypothetical protein
VSGARFEVWAWIGPNSPRTYIGVMLEDGVVVAATRDCPDCYKAADAIPLKNGAAAVARERAEGLWETVAGPWEEDPR